MFSLYFLTLLYVVYADNDTCASDYKYASDIDKSINITESCTETTPCITKCCPANQILVSMKSNETFSISCMDSKNLALTYNLSNLDDYSDVVFYENNIKQDIIKSGKKLEEFIQIYNDDFRDPHCSLDHSRLFTKPQYEVYILKNGSLATRQLNYLYPWLIPSLPGQFCIDHQIVLNGSNVVETELVIRMFHGGEAEKDDAAAKRMGIAIGMLVSCVFLLLVLAVYAVLPQLRILAGMILMAYASTLTAMFIFRAAQIIAPLVNLLSRMTCLWLGMKICRPKQVSKISAQSVTGKWIKLNLQDLITDNGTGFVVYYTVVACFTWMNVMSFDIWWSMRGFRKLRQIHRCGDLVKFCWYGLYGWGAPLLPIIFIIVVEDLDLTYLPYFVKAHYSDACFIPDEEQLLYVNGPILITVCINITLFLMTVYNIWRIRCGVSQHSGGNSRINKEDETNRFSLYLKLSLVMGVNWILQILSAVYESGKSWWWFAPNVFNSLTGLFIFIIFICKRRVIGLLCNRFSIKNQFIQKWIHMDSTFKNSTSMRSSRNSKKKPQYSVSDTSDISDLEKK